MQSPDQITAQVQPVERPVRPRLYGSVYYDQVDRRWTVAGLSEHPSLHNAESPFSNFTIPTDAEIEAARADACRLVAAEADNERLRAALHKIAYEPIGHAEDTHRQVLDGCVCIARAALEPNP